MGLLSLAGLIMKLRVSNQLCRGRYQERGASPAP